MQTDPTFSDRWCPLSHMLLASAGFAPVVACTPEWERAGFNKQVCQLAAWLRQGQVGTAALYFTDAARLACAFLACSLEGVAMVLPPHRAPECLDWAGTQADLWLTDAGAVDGPLPEGKPVWCVHDTTIEVLRAVLPAGTFAGELLPLFPETVFCPGELRMDTRVWFRTSGSTGTPKVIVKTVAQLKAEVEALRMRLRLSEASVVDRVLGSVSPQHLYGFSFRVVLSLCAGWPIHRSQCAYPEMLLQASLGADCSVWVASPVLLNVLGEERLAAALRGRVAYLLSSAGALPQETARRIQAHLGVCVHEIYGSTETGAIASRQGTDVWQPLPGVQYAQDASGALRVNSPWSGGEQQLEDLVEPRQQGFVLQGRRDRIIKLADKRVSLPVLEVELQTHRWVAQAACGLHPAHGRLTALVALSPEGIAAWRDQGRAAVVRALRDHLQQTQDAVALPRIWRIVHRLPCDAQGKLPLAAWQQAVQARPTAPEWVLLAGDGAAAAEARFQGQVPLDLVYFGGHFPNFPLVPGVVELDWVWQLAQQAFSCPPHFLRADALKFRKFVRPDDVVTVTLTWQPERGRLGFVLEGPEGVCASGRLVLADERTQPDSDKAVSAS